MQGSKIMNPKVLNPKVMFYVQHLLGIGHVFRAMRIARGLARAGCRTHIVWGGKKIPSMDTTGVTMHYLRAVHAGEDNLSILLLNDGTLLDDAGKSARARQLLGIYNDIKPDILITEAFPFGRRQMRFELIPLMEAATTSTPKPLIVSSIRDILQENRAPKRVRESLDYIHEWFDIVMVHGDPDFVAIEATLDHADEIADKIRYTGLVTPEPLVSDVTPSLTPDVIISAGGGAVGKAVMTAAVDAMALCRTLPNNWCLTTGPDLPQKDYDRIVSRAPPSMTITRFIPDLTAVMAQAKVSVSRAGYNTVGDLLRAGCSSVLIPYQGGLETEQYHRAAMMDRLGLATMLLDKDLTAQSLARAVDKAFASKSDNPTTSSRQSPNDNFAPIDMNGADNAAQVLIDECR